jgi:hypothetical protein
MSVQAMTTEQILARIAELQEIQKRKASHSPEWESASKELHKLFAEMNRREPFKG